MYMLQNHAKSIRCKKNLYQYGRVKTRGSPSQQGFQDDFVTVWTLWTTRRRAATLRDRAGCCIPAPGTRDLCLWPTKICFQPRTGGNLGMIFLENVTLKELMFWYVLQMWLHWSLSVAFIFEGKHVECSTKIWWLVGPKASISGHFDFQFVDGSRTQDLDDETNRTCDLQNSPSLQLSAPRSTYITKHRCSTYLEATFYHPLLSWCSCSAGKISFEMDYSYWFDWIIHL